MQDGQRGPAGPCVLVLPGPYSVKVDFQAGTYPTVHRDGPNDVFPQDQEFVLLLADSDRRSVTNVQKGMFFANNFTKTAF